MQIYFQQIEKEGQPFDEMKTTFGDFMDLKSGAQHAKSLSYTLDIPIVMHEAGKKEYHYYDNTKGKKPNFNTRICAAQTQILHWYPLNDLIGEYYDGIKSTLIQTYQAKKHEKDDLIVLIVIYNPLYTILNICTEQKILHN